MGYHHRKRKDLERRPGQLRSHDYVTLLPMVGSSRQSQIGGPRGQTEQSEKAIQKKGIAYSQIPSTSAQSSTPETLDDSLSARDGHFTVQPRKNKRLAKLHSMIANVGKNECGYVFAFVIASPRTIYWYRGESKLVCMEARQLGKHFRRGHI